MRKPGVAASVRGFFGADLGDGLRVLQRRLLHDGRGALVQHLLLAPGAAHPPARRSSAGSPIRAQVEQRDRRAGGQADRDRRARRRSRGSSATPTAPTHDGVRSRRSSRSSSLVLGATGAFAQPAARAQQGVGGEARPAPQSDPRLPREARVLVRHPDLGRLPAARLARAQHGDRRDQRRAHDALRRPVRGAPDRDRARQPARHRAAVRRDVPLSPRRAHQLARRARRRDRHRAHVRPRPHG